MQSLDDITRMKTIMQEKGDFMKIAIDIIKVLFKISDQYPKFD